jgi:hypothetical protein
LQPLIEPFLMSQGFQPTSSRIFRRSFASPHTWMHRWSGGGFESIDLQSRVLDVTHFQVRGHKIPLGKVHAKASVVTCFLPVGLVTQSSSFQLFETKRNFRDVTARQQERVNLTQCSLLFSQPNSVEGSLAIRYHCRSASSIHEIKYSIKPK